MKTMTCSEERLDSPAVARFDVELDVQVALDESRALNSLVPSLQQFEHWVEATLAGAGRQQDAELSLRVIDTTEMIRLNETYRHKSGSTNVLSFPFSAPDGVHLPLLGDIAVCMPVVVAESQQQGKPLEHHWAHMIVHGVLHLLGYDHVEQKQAQQMEQLEIDILARFGISNPYGEAKNL